VGRRIDCTVPNHQEVYVILPDEWLGKHALKRDEALKAIQAISVDSLELRNAVMALCLVEDWGGIPGLEGKDPEQWQVENLPLSVITWMTTVVIGDFNDAFRVPKNSYEPSPTTPNKPVRTKK
jgi:hypothetical protein